jgi:hypothetical protein
MSKDTVESLEQYASLRLLLLHVHNPYYSWSHDRITHIESSSHKYIFFLSFAAVWCRAREKQQGKTTPPSRFDFAADWLFLVFVST